MKKYYSRILGNKNKRWSQISALSIPNRYLLWKDNIHGYTSHWSRTEANWEIIWRTPKSLGWWTNVHHFPNSIWSSISNNVPQWIYEYTKITWFLALKYDMDYLMHHSHEPIMWSRTKIHITEEIFRQFYFKVGDAEIRKTKEYSNFLHTYCDEDHAKDIYDGRSFASTVHLWNGAIIDCCANK